MTSTYLRLYDGSGGYLQQRHTTRIVGPDVVQVDLLPQFPTGTITHTPTLD